MYIHRHIKIDIKLNLGYECAAQAFSLYVSSDHMILEKYSTKWECTNSGLDQWNGRLRNSSTGNSYHFLIVIIHKWLRYYLQQ